MPGIAPVPYHYDSRQNLGHLLTLGASSRSCHGAIGTSKKGGATATTTGRRDFRGIMLKGAVPQWHEGYLEKKARETLERKGYRRGNIPWLERLRLQRKGSQKTVGRVKRVFTTKGTAVTFSLMDQISGSTFARGEGRAFFGNSTSWPRPVPSRLGQLRPDVP